MSDETDTFAEEERLAKLYSQPAHETSHESFGEEERLAKLYTNPQATELKAEDPTMDNSLPEIADSGHITPKSEKHFELAASINDVLDNIPAYKEAHQNVEQRGWKRGIEHTLESTGKGLALGSARVSDAVFGTTNPYTGHDEGIAGLEKQRQFKGQEPGEVAKFAAEQVPLIESMALPLGPAAGSGFKGAAVSGAAVNTAANAINQQIAHRGEYNAGEGAGAMVEGAGFGAGFHAGGKLINKALAPVRNYMQKRAQTAALAAQEKAWASFEAAHQQRQKTFDLVKQHLPGLQQQVMQRQAAHNVQSVDEFLMAQQAKLQQQRMAQEASMHASPAAQYQPPAPGPSLMQQRMAQQARGLKEASKQVYAQRINKTMNNLQLPEAPHNLAGDEAHALETKVAEGAKQNEQAQIQQQAQGPRELPPQVGGPQDVRVTQAPAFARRGPAPASGPDAAGGRSEAVLEKPKYPPVRHATADEHVARNEQEFSKYPGSFKYHPQTSEGKGVNAFGKQLSGMSDEELNGLSDFYGQRSLMPGVRKKGDIAFTKAISDEKMRRELRRVEGFPGNWEDAEKAPEPPVLQGHTEAEAPPEQPQSPFGAASNADSGRFGAQRKRMREQEAAKSEQELEKREQERAEFSKRVESFKSAGFTHDNALDLSKSFRDMTDMRQKLWKYYDIPLDKRGDAAAKQWTRAVVEQAPDEQTTEWVREFVAHYNEHMRFLKTTLGANVASHQMFAALHSVYKTFGPRTMNMLKPKQLQYLMGHFLTSDVIREFADPAFSAEYQGRMFGKLQQATKGLMVPKEPAAQAEFHKARFATDAEIQAMQHLTQPIKDALIDANAIMADQMKSHREEISRLENVIKASKWKYFANEGKVLRALQADMRANFEPGNKNLFEQIGSFIAHSGVQMSVAGNYHLHGYHALEAMGAAMSAPKAYAQAVKMLSTSRTAINFANEFNTSGAMMKMRLASGNPITSASRKVWDATMQLPGVKQVAGSKVGEAVGDTLSGQLPESMKLQTLNATAGIIAAKEMGYSSAEQFMSDFTSGRMQPHQEFEACLRIATQVNKWIGTAPYTYRDMSGWGHLGTTPGIGVFIRGLEPFKHMKVIQMRVFSNSIARMTKAVDEKRWDDAGRELGVTAGMAGFLTMIAGSAAIPKQFRELKAIITGDDHEDTPLKRNMDSLAIVGNVLHARAEHMSPTPLPMADDLTSGGIYERTARDVSKAVGASDPVQKAVAIAGLASLSGLEILGGKISPSQLVSKARKLNDLRTKGGEEVWAAQEPGFRNDLQNFKKAGAFMAGKGWEQKSPVYGHAIVPRPETGWGVLNALGATWGEANDKEEWLTQMHDAHAAENAFSETHTPEAYKLARTEYLNQNPAARWLYYQNKMKDDDPRKEKNLLVLQKMELESIFAQMNDHKRNGQVFHSASFWQNAIEHPERYDNKGNVLAHRHDMQKMRSDRRHYNQSAQMLENDPEVK